MKGNLALGYVALDTVVQRSLQLTNSGLNTATYRVEVEPGLPLQVTPADGKLTPTGSPGSVCTLKVELTAEIAGPLSGNILDPAYSSIQRCTDEVSEFSVRDESSFGRCSVMQYLLCMADSGSELWVPGMLRHVLRGKGS